MKEHYKLFMNNNIYIFPDYFSENVISEILQNGEENDISVYRVGKYGKDKEKSFLNYYDEVSLGLKTVKNKEKYLESCKNDLDKLSVSCYYDKEDIEYYFNITLKDDYPERILLQGVTNGKYGLSQITSKRKNNVTNSHVDWWIFRNSTPWLEFKEVM